MERSPAPYTGLPEAEEEQRAYSPECLEGRCSQKFSSRAQGLASRSEPSLCELKPRGGQEEGPEGQRTSRVGMPSNKEHPCQYQQDEGYSGRSSTPKCHSRRYQRNHPRERSHYREPEDQAQNWHVLHRLVDGGLRPSRESSGVAQGVSRADAGRRVVGAEEHGEDAYGPAAHARRPPLQPVGEQVDGQGNEPDEGNLDEMEPHEPHPLFYGLAGAARPLRMKDLQQGEGKRCPEQDDPAQHQALHATPPSASGLAGPTCFLPPLSRSRFAREGYRRMAQMSDLPYPRAYSPNVLEVGVLGILHSPGPMRRASLVCGRTYLSRGSDPFGLGHRGTSGSREGVGPPVAAVCDCGLAPGCFKALSALALALLAQLPQFLLRMFQPLPHPHLDLVAHRPEPLQHRVVGEVLVAARVLEDPREGRPHAREGLGTAVLGAGAYDDEVVEGLLAHVLLEALGVLVGDVDADLPHSLDGAGVYLVGGVYPGAVRLEAVAPEIPQEPLGHLAPGRVLRAQEQHLLLLHRRLLSIPYPTSTGFAVPPAFNCSANSSGSSLLNMPSTALSRSYSTLMNSTSPISSSA